MKTKAPKFTAAECQAIHNEAHASGLAAADKMETWYGCGFAWVDVKPATQTFARWQRDNNIASYSDYDKAMRLWVSAYGQNANKKYAYANGYASVLQLHGINGHSGSRAD